MNDFKFFDRDLSWLTFNRLILEQAEKPDLPLLERLNFLAIWSSNLDEFYRVRIPVLAALRHLGREGKIPVPNGENLLARAQLQIMQQQLKFGHVFTAELIPALAKNKIMLLFNERWPPGIDNQVYDYFYSQLMAFLRPVEFSVKEKDFFPENNQLYFLINLRDRENTGRTFLLNVPTAQLPRFFKTELAGITYILFLDDIIRYNLNKIFRDETVDGCYWFKITRDAELDLHDDYPGDLPAQIERQLIKRDLGIATRFLHQPGIPLRTLRLVSDSWDLHDESIIEGGVYHKLKDLFNLPVNNPALRYKKWPAIPYHLNDPADSIFNCIAQKDQLISTPYQSYDAVLRFLNEAALDEGVEEIYVTLYRVASESRIVNALINAAKEGKQVTVIVELKARFDEANNVKWAKRMKAAGVRIIYSVVALKVHAKITLVKRRENGRAKYYGLLATGNFNETTAAFYTDHILMTANGALLREVELLFVFLAGRKKPGQPEAIQFEHLLVAQFNLHQRFLDLIDREIDNARHGLPSGIAIKLNNLEEQTLITKLYEASQAGVRVTMIVRSICCLIPGVKGMSENITIKRIVDRYLEHGRIYTFQNAGDPEVYLGSADWMNRNIYHRIEVCFPVYDELLKTEIITMMNLGLQDNVQAVLLGTGLENIPLETDHPDNSSQEKIYALLSRI